MGLIGLRQDTVVNAETAKNFFSKFVKGLNEQAHTYCGYDDLMNHTGIDTTALPVEKKAVLAYCLTISNTLEKIISAADIIDSMNTTVADITQVVINQGDANDFALVLETFNKTYLETGKTDMEHIQTLQGFVNNITTFPIDANPRLFVEAVYATTPNVDPKEVVQIATSSKTQFLELFRETLETASAQASHDLSASWDLHTQNVKPAVSRLH